MSVEIEMAKQEYGTLVTEYGEAATVKAWMNGEKVEIVRFAVGDANGAYYSPDAAMTQLIHEVWSGDVAEIEVDEKRPNEIRVHAYIPPDVGGFIIREAALFDKKNNMIAICNFPALNKVAIESGAIGDFHIYMSVFFTHAEAVDFVVDMSVVNATKEDLRKHNESKSSHLDLFQNMGSVVELTTLDHRLNAYPQVMLTAYRYGAGMGGAGEGPTGGSDAVQAPARAVFHGSGSLTVYTTEAIARPGTAKEVRKISDTEYIVTYDGDDTSAVYIQLLCAPKLRIEDFLSYKFITLHHGLGTYPQVIAGALRYGAGMGAIGEGPAGGTDLKQVFVRVEYHDRDTLTIYTTENVARPNVQKEIYKAGDCDYAVAYKADGVDSVHIQLIASKEKMVLPEKVVVSPNLGLKILEE